MTRLIHLVPRAARSQLLCAAIRWREPRAAPSRERFSPVQLPISRLLAAQKHGRRRDSPQSGNSGVLSCGIDFAAATEDRDIQTGQSARRQGASHWRRTCLYFALDHASDTSIRRGATYPVVAVILARRGVRAIMRELELSPVQCAGHGVEQSRSTQSDWANDRGATVAVRQSIAPRPGASPLGHATFSYSMSVVGLSLILRG